MEYLELFRGLYRTSPSMEYHGERWPLTTAAFNIFKISGMTPEVEALLEEASKAREWKPGYRDSYWNRPLCEEEYMNPSLGYVYFVHGGGKNYLELFLKGQLPGYPLENGGLGIQVHPVKDINPETLEKLENRVRFYAEKSVVFFDQPAQLVGRIEARFVQGAPNSYEAGIPACHAEHIEVIELTELDGFLIR